MMRPLQFQLFFLIALCVSLFQYSHGQNVTNQTTLYIPSNLEIHVDGDFTNSGFTENQGSFYIGGNWQNTTVYQGLGRVILNGDQPQRFSNNRNAVHQLTIDGAGLKSISQTLPVTNRLDLLSGNILVSDNDTLLLAGGVTIGGGSVDSYIEGALTHVGSGYKFFPIGKNGTYRPLAMMNIIGASPVTEVEVFDKVPSLKLPSATTRYSTVYWQRKTISGTFLNSPVSLGYDLPDNFTDDHALDIFQSDALDQAFSALGDVSVDYGTGSETDQVTSEVAATGNVFVLGETIPPGGLPGQFYLSTSLSPRASNPANQVVRIFGNELQEGSFQFVVYNRWGLVVYETTSLPDMITKGWDGRSKGDYLPSGAYPFILKALTKTGEQVERRGAISVVN